MVLRTLTVAAGMTAILAVAPAAAVAARPNVRLAGVHAMDGRMVGLAAARFTVRGRVPPARAGGSAEIAFRRSGRAVKVARLQIGPDGRFAARFRPGMPGQITVRIRTDGLATAWRRVLVLRPLAAPGERGPHIRFLQQRLAALGYQAPATGRLDGAAQRAVLAFRKVNGLLRVTNASRAVFGLAAAGRGGFPVRFPRHGRHVEGDLTRQVLALVEPGGRVHRIYPISSGRPGLRTPTGTFRVFSHHWGWRGGMLDGSYFVHSQGFTCGIHGYPWVPTYPASHCCLRVPIPDAHHIRWWVHLGTVVDVYHRPYRA